MTIRHFPPGPLPQRRALRRRGPRDRRFYDPSQPRDGHGRWSEGGGSAASAQGHVAKDIDRRMDEIIKGGKHVGESEECVALVKHLNPGIGPAKNWEEGPKIKGPGDPPLERGTALATFKNGRYENRASGNHAVLFLEYGEKDGRRGMWVLDQFRGEKGKPKRTFKAFGRSAEHYSIIKRKQPR